MTRSKRSDRQAGSVKHTRRSGPPAARLEALEPRVLLSGDLPSIQKIEADNRGLVVLTATRDLDASTINSSSVKIFTAGDDKRLNTADDVQVLLAELSYDNTARTISFRSGEIAANQKYKVKLDSSLIKGANGKMLDGEFNGANAVSGDGVEGGDLVFFTRSPAQQNVRIYTTSGVINLNMLTDSAPKTVTNFLSYANEGSYDTSFYHRFAQSGNIPFVLQGGGFTAATGFPAIPQKPPVVNEFAVSNKRGTVAMAKLGSSPNSATNQYFFNLSDNSQNLDNQNGGFTVFARVADDASLAVMDALARFQTVNASSTNAAFNELPVIDKNAVTARNGQIIPTDVVRMTRVALMVDVESTPGQQLDDRVAFTFTSPNSTAAVTVYDLTGQGLGNVQDLMTVRFGARNAITSITLKNDFSGRLGISVAGASSIGSVADSRRNPTGEVAFIAVQTGSIGSVKVKNGISGENINGFALPGGFALAEDIDGDGSTTDKTGVVVDSTTGALSTLTLGGPLAGDIVARGGLASVNVGSVSGADFVSSAGSSRGSYRFGSVDNSSVTSFAGISSISATTWRNSSTTKHTISAPSLSKLSIPGDFEAQLTLTGDTALPNKPTLGGASVGGGIYDSTWNITGNTGSLSAATNSVRWKLNITGNSGPLSFGNSIASSAKVTGSLSSFNATQWFTGAVSADTIVAFSTSKGGRGGGNGDFQGNITVNNASGAATALNRAAIAGNLLEATVDIKGAAPKFAIDGDVTNTVFTFRTTLGSLSMRTATNVNVNVQSDAKNITALRWDGGVMSGGLFENVTTTGSRSVPGDMKVNFNNINALLKLTTQNRGDLTTTISTRGGTTYSVDGDLLDSKITLTEPNTLNSLKTLTVRGRMTNSEFRAPRNVTTMAIGAMENSGVYVGAPTNQIGLPADAANTNANARIDNFKITGIPNTPSFVNSFVVTGQLGIVTILRPQTDNGGVTFGLAANSIKEITTNFGNGQTVHRLNPRASLIKVGDYKVQINAAPGGVS